MKNYFLCYTLLLISLMSTGCNSITHYTPIVTMIPKSPVILNKPERNGPIETEVRVKMEIASQNLHKKRSRTSTIKSYLSESEFDTFNDLVEKDSLVFVAVSGGGGRAVSTAMHALAQIEKRYNQMNVDTSESFFKKVDVFSGVSGGSMFLAYLGRLHAHLEAKQKNLTRSLKVDAESDDINSYQNFLSDIASYNVYLTPMKTGIMAGAFYLSPGNLGIGPFLGLFTDWGYLDLLSHTQHYVLSFGVKRNSDKQNSFSFHVKRSLDKLKPISFTLADLPQKPRFFFNATDLETGQPFVLTQRPIHLPIEPLIAPTARLDLKLKDARDHQNRSPLSGVTTLEDINSSPNKVALTTAAMASVAFPIGPKPLRFKKFGFDPTRLKVFKSDIEFLLSDGGIYDNSGLYSVLSLIEFLDFEKTLREKNKQKTKYVIIYINASTTRYDVHSPKRPAKNEHWSKSYFPLKLGFPIRSPINLKALSLIHYANQRRAEDIALLRFAEIASKEDLGVLFFPISLSQLSQDDPNAIADPFGTFKRLKQIPTQFYISNDDDVLIGQAVSQILNTPQSRGWTINEINEDRLVDAICRALKN